MQEMPVNEPLPRWLEAACLWEATAPKAGNVHPAARFDDLDYLDFVSSANLIRAYYEQHLEDRLDAPGAVCASILELAERTGREVGKNTNLGILLLLCPLAAVPLNEPLVNGIEEVIDGFDVEDSQRVFQAIATLQPGGMGQVEKYDLASRPTEPLKIIMAAAADHDLIARQYATGFADVLNFGLDRLDNWWQQTNRHVDRTVIGLHLEWMAQYPDSLIARKLGLDMATQAAERAGEVLQAGWPDTPQGVIRFAELDRWLRADGHRRNPGTSADLVAATLFAGFRERLISL